MAEISFIEATRRALERRMELDPTIFVVGEGVGTRGGNFNTTVGLYEKFGPKRLRDTPIVERGFIGMCTGAAMTGARPIVDFMFIDFALDGFGEIVNQIAKVQYMSNGRIKMPLVLRGAIGIFASAATHHSGNYYSLFMHIPGIHVVVPSNAYDAKGLFNTALTGDDPVLFLEHKGLMNKRMAVPDEDYFIPFGKAAVARMGNDITVVALTSMVPKTLEAATLLEKEGISVEVIDLRTVSPLDIPTILDSVHKTGRLLIADEDYSPAGVGAEISSQVMVQGFDDLDAPVMRLNGGFAPIPYSPPLESALVPNTQTIAQAVRDLMAE